jgi:predicted dehydrogenase
MPWCQWRRILNSKRIFVTTDKISVAIVGLGRIGATYAPATESDGSKLIVRNHLDAALGRENAKLVGLIDPDVSARDRVRKRANGLVDNILLESLNDLSAGSADVIVLSTPTESRVHDVAMAIEKRPRILVVEKPIATSLADAVSIARHVEQAGITLRVNFHRRFDARLQAFRSKFDSIPKSVILRYGKGLHNYGSHLVDLIIHWFGAVKSVQAISWNAIVGDPTVTFCCRMAAGFDVLVVGIEGLDYDQFEGDFFFQTSRLELANSGVELREYHPVNGLYYEGYSQLGSGKFWDTPRPVGGLRELYDCLFEHLVEGKDLPGCDGHAALAGVAVLDSAVRSAEAGGKLIEPGHQGHNDVSQRGSW